MIRRRDLMLAGFGLGALGVAEALRPRRKLVLLKNGTIDEALPREFGSWTSQVSNLVSPEQAGRLANSLYSEIVGRTYFNEDTDAAVMMMVAYGDTQSDLLQLHRPESCYPAVGFTLNLSQPATLALSEGAVIPGRRVIASMQDRSEKIFYWARLGERLPQSGGDQQTARLRNAMEGYVADGILVRCSAFGEPDEAFAMMDGFVRELLRSTARDKLPALIGTNLAQKVV